MLTAQTLTDGHRHHHVVRPGFFGTAGQAGHAVAGRREGAGAPLREELEDGVKLEGLCILDVSIDLVVELDNPGRASVARASSPMASQTLAVREPACKYLVHVEAGQSWPIYKKYTGPHHHV